MSTFLERAATVERWVRSCETQEQIDLCKEAVEVFVVPRNGEVVEDWDKIIGERRVYNAIEEMEKIVTHGRG